MSSQSICVSCAKQFADSFCCCAYPLPLLCTVCFERHRAKGGALVHCSFPVQGSGKVRSAEEAAALRKRVFEVSEAESSMRAALQEFEDCEQKLAQVFHELKTELEQLHAEVLGELHLHKRKTEEVVRTRLEEMKATLLDQGVSCLESGRLLSYFVDKGSAAEFLPQCIAVRFETPSAVVRFPRASVEEKPHGQPWQFELPCLKPDSLSCFQCLTQQWSTAVQLSEQIEVDAISAVLRVEPEDFVCFGGFFPATTAKTYLVRRDGAVRRAAALSPPRFEFGAVAVGAAVYVFGGLDESTRLLQTAEVLSLDKDVWTSLPPMLSARSNFIPCEVSQRIYLISSGASEMFDIAAGAYLPLPFVLPASAFRTVVVADGEALLIAQGTRVSRWRAGNCLEVATEHNTEASECYNTKPVLVQSRIFILTTKNVVSLALD